MTGKLNPNSADMSNLKIVRPRWNPEAVVNFWEYIAQREDLRSEYFTNQVGHGVAEFLVQAGRLGPNTAVIDYGCGPGFLIQHLIARGAKCSAVDSSEKAVTLANSKYAGRSGWEGATVLGPKSPPLAKEQFDLVTCVETLEHLPADLLGSLVYEIRGVLKPGGAALFTTPHNEKLQNNMIFCPFCQSEFHKVQHQRSFTADEMRQLLESHGFRVIFCRDLDFGEFQRGRPYWRDMSLRSLSWAVGRKRREIADRFFGDTFPRARLFNFLLKPGPHLCVLVERPS